jgi:hypothetical protein
MGFDVVAKMRRLTTHNSQHTFPQSLVDAFPQEVGVRNYSISDFMSE